MGAPEESAGGERPWWAAAIFVAVVLLLDVCGDEGRGRREDRPSTGGDDRAASEGEDPTSSGLVVSRRTFTEAGMEWPLTADEGVLRCESGAVVIEVYGNDYALNGMARSLGRYRDLHDIWADDPEVEGLKISVGPLIDMGLTLC